MSRTCRLGDIRSWLTMLSLGLLSFNAIPAAAADIPAAIRQKLANGESVELIIEYAGASIDKTLSQKPRTKTGAETTATLKLRADRYRALKLDIDRQPPAAAERVRDFSHLPFDVRRFNKLTHLQSWLDDGRIVAVYEDTPLQTNLTSSLPLVQQPTVSTVGYAGSGTTVAVIDAGINISNAAFGNCTAIGSPASCRIIANQLVGSATGSTDNAHGTNVSAIVASVAPGTRIAMLNPFSGTSALTSNVLAGINWAIANASTYNIVAINMSLGDSGNYSSTCNNAFSTPINNAINAGITVVAASGNNAYTTGISSPACVANVISVGAVYNKSYGAITWSSGCTDSNPDTDEITCFSNSANHLTLLAPGALITAGGIQQGGTSQASPHVAGAIAVLRAAFPGETLASTRNRLLDNGVPITDSRNGLTKPRLNLAAAARPANDHYANRITLNVSNGSNGSASGTNRLATAESGESVPVSSGGGRSVWWRWTAPAAGQVSLNTSGSSFDTQLAVYITAATPASLGRIAANDDDGSANSSALLFQARAGSEYIFQIDGSNNAQGNITLNWNLNTAANANLSSNISGSGNSYTVTVSNAGPQNATNASVQLTLPTNASLGSSSAACSQSGSMLSCTLGTLNAGSSVSFTLTINWSNNEGGTISVTSSSDLTDNTPADNSSAVSYGLTSDADVPTLPEWAAMILGSLLLMRASSRHGSRPISKSGRTNY